MYCTYVAETIIWAGWQSRSAHLVDLLVRGDWRNVLVVGRSGTRRSRSSSPTDSILLSGLQGNSVIPTSPLSITLDLAKAVPWTRLVGSLAVRLALDFPEVSTSMRLMSENPKRFPG
jgi:hypothetical protein